MSKRNEDLPPLGTTTLDAEQYTAFFLLHEELVKAEYAVAVTTLRALAEALGVGKARPSEGATRPLGVNLQSAFFQANMALRRTTDETRRTILNALAQALLVEL